MPNLFQPDPPAAVVRGQRRAFAVRSAWVALALCLVILGGGGFLLQRQIQGVRHEEQQELSTIADLKASQISAWYAGRMTLAGRIQHNRILQDQFLRILDGTATLQTRADLEAWLEDLQADGYQQVALFGRDGRVFLRAPKDAESIVRDATDPDFQKALAARQVLIQRLHRDAADPKSHLSLWVPVTQRKGGLLQGLLLLQVDASPFLAPYLATWPYASGTAETQLVERIGDDAVYLNDPRFAPGTALNLRIPIEGNPGHPAVMAVLGQEGLVTGRDYRNVPVLAALRRVPGTPWFLIAKVDAAEIYRSARQESWTGVLILLMVAGLVASGSALLFRQRALAEARDLLQIEREATLSNERYRILMERASDIILVLGPEGRILEANEQAVAAYGYSHEALLGLSVLDLRAPETLDLAAVQLARVRNGELNRFETLHRRSDGTVFPVEVSSAQVLMGEDAALVSFIRDITGRKAQEAELERMSRLYAALSQVNQAIVWSKDRQALLDKICEVMVVFGKFSLAWIGWDDPASHQVRVEAKFGDRWGILDRVTVRSDDTPEGYGPLGTALREGHPCLLNDYQGAPEAGPWRQELLASGLASMAAFPIRQGGMVVAGIAVYATEKDFFGPHEAALLEEAAGDVSFALDHLASEAKRREAESALSERERFLREAEEAGGVGCYTWDIPTDRWVATAALERIFGIGPEHPRDLAGWLALVEPSHRETLRAHVEERLAQHGRFDHEYPIRRPLDGQLLWLRGTGEFRWDEAGQPLALTGVIRDITDRKARELELARTNRLYAALSQVNQAIVWAKDRQDLLDRVCRVLVEQGAFSMAWIGWQDPGAQRVRVAARCGDDRGMLDRVEVRTDDSPEGRGAVGPAITQGRPAVFNDLLGDPRSAPWLTELAECGFASMAAFPVQEGGVTRGAIAVYAVDKAFFAAPEITLLEEVARDLSFALDHLASEVERRAAETALLASEDKFSKAFHASPDSVNINRLADGVYLDVNDGFTRVSGYTAEEVLGRSALPGDLGIWVHAEDRARLQEGLAREGKVEGLEALFRRKDGSILTGLMSGSLIEVGGEQCTLTITRDITDRKLQEQKLERMTQLYAALSQVNQAIVWSKGESELLEKICEVMVVFGKFGMAWIGENDPATAAVRQVAAYGDTQGYLETLQVRSDDTAMGRGPTGIALREERACIMNAFMAESQTQPWHQNAIRCGFASAAAFPIRREGQIWGALTVYAPVAGFFGEPEVALLEEAAMDISFALDHLAGEARRREMEVSLRNQKDEFETIFNRVPIQVWYKDTQNRYLRVNEKACQDLGLAREQIEGHSAEELFPAFAEGYFRDDQIVLASGQPKLGNVYQINTANGQVHWLRADKVPILDPAGHPTGLVAIVEDLTEWRHAEESLRTVYTAMEQAPVSVVITDSNGTILYVNPAFVRVTGYTVDEVLGQDTRVLKSNLHGSELYHEMWQALISGQVWSGELQNRRKDGEIFTAMVSVSPIRDSLDTVIRYVAIMEDITERRRAEDERRELEVQLLQTQKLESLGALAGGLAHDMNNVLGAVLGVASTLREKQGETGPDGKPLDTIIQACMRGRGVVKSLLYFARKDLQEERPIDLNALAQEMVQLLGQTTLKRIQLDMDLQEDLPQVRGDGGALNHALMNLCVNALDAMPEGGTLRIATATAPDGGVDLRVEDSGVGMTPAVLARCLEPFYTTKPRGKGTGLGLPMVQSTLQAHDGRFELHSAPGEGTQAILHFPPARLLAPAVPEAPVAEHQAAAPARSLDLLLVDDDDLVRDSVQELLTMLGHRCLVAPGGQEALDLLESGRKVDLVILDMNMPGMSGAQALPRIRALRPGLPVILATGFSSEDLAPIMAGRSHIQSLSKPFSVLELKARIESLALPGGDPLDHA